MTSRYHGLPPPGRWRGPPHPFFHRGPAERTVAEPAREGGEAGPAPAGMEEVEVVVLAAPAAETGAALELQHGGVRLLEVV